MTVNQRVQSAKSYIWGFVAGLIAAPIIAFSAGWVSTTGARAEAVELAKVETLAGICTAGAQKSWAAQNMDLAALKGWDNRVKREELVATLSDIDMPEPLVKKVTNGCNKSLA